MGDLDLGSLLLQSPLNTGRKHPPPWTAEKSSEEQTSTLKTSVGPSRTSSSAADISLGSCVPSSSSSQSEVEVRKISPGSFKVVHTPVAHKPRPPSPSSLNATTSSFPELDDEMQDECPFCSQSFPLKELEAHTNSCPMAELLPPNVTQVHRVRPAHGSRPSSAGPLFKEKRKGKEKIWVDLDESLMDEDYLANPYLSGTNMTEKDAVFARQMLEDDERLVEHEKRKRQEEDERLFQEFLRKEQEEERAEKRAREEVGAVCDSCQRQISLEAEGDTSEFLVVCYLEACPHVFCRSCITKHIKERATSAEAALSDIKCPCCQVPLRNVEIQASLPQTEYERLLNKEFSNLITSNSDFVQCPNFKCGVTIERDVSGGAATPTSLVVDGVKLTLEAFRHRESYRFRCRCCDTEFCADCKQIPYHFGQTCAEFVKAQNSRRCRFCDEVIDSLQSPPFLLSPAKKQKTESRVDVCNAVECRIRANEVCTKSLKCGHPCGGIRNEKSCLPCMHEDCADKSGINGDDFCAICYSEPLFAAPCIKLKCGHVFHVECVREKLRRRWPGARITFGFMNCAACGAEAQHPALQELLKPLLELKDEVMRKCSLRIRYEGTHKLPVITEKGGKYYNKPMAYAEDYFCYYPCFKCKRPYFGGMKNCEAMMDAGKDDNANNNAANGASGSDAKDKNAKDKNAKDKNAKDKNAKENKGKGKDAKNDDKNNPKPSGSNAENKDNNNEDKKNEQGAGEEAEDQPFNEEELVCGACIPNSQLAMCKIHGSEFIEYKCKFCCNIAQWYCWGSTHFCTTCHKLQEKGTYLTKKKREELPKCDPKKCTLPPHPPNGTEFALGCAICERKPNF